MNISPLFKKAMSLLGIFFVLFCAGFVSLLLLDTKSTESGVEFLGENEFELGWIERIEFVYSRASPILGLNFPWERRIVLAKGADQVADLRKFIESLRIEGADGSAMGSFEPKGTLIVFSKTGASKLEVFSSSSGYWRIVITDKSSPSSSMFYYRPSFSDVIEHFK